MPREYGSDFADHMPLVLADQAEQEDIGGVYEGALTSPRFFKASILIAIATAAGIAALFIADPVTLVANVTASMVGNSAPTPGIEPSAPAVQAATDAPALTQSVADAQDLAPFANDAPKNDLRSDEVAVPEPAARDQTETSRDQTEKNESPPDALFKQFQAWAADQDAQADVKPAQPVQGVPAQVAQDAPAQVVEHAHAPHRLMQRHRQLRAVHNARAEMPTQNIRRVRRVQTARAERPPVRDARAQEQPVQTAPAQNTQAPSFLPVFGQRN